MENNNITVTILKKVNLPKRINGKDLYQFLEADPEKETVLFHYQYGPLHCRYIVSANIPVIEIPVAENQNLLIDYQFIVLENELLLELIDLYQPYPH